jgi:hypothetical protein
VTVAFIRNQERMVYQTVFDHVRTHLDLLGWMSSNPLMMPFGASVPVTIVEETPEPKLGPLAPNTIAFSEGRTPDDSEGELGASWGGLWVVDHTFFIDIYAENIGIAKALSSDLRAVLAGRLPGTSRYLPMNDYSGAQVTPAEGHMLHFEDVEIDRPMGSPSKLRWEVVKATCVHEFTATEG